MTWAKRKLGPIAYTFSKTGLHWILAVSIAQNQLHLLRYPVGSLIIFALMVFGRFRLLLVLPFYLVWRIAVALQRRFKKDLLPNDLPEKHIALIQKYLRLDVPLNVPKSAIPASWTIVEEVINDILRFFFGQKDVAVNRLGPYVLGFTGSMVSTLKGFQIARIETLDGVRGFFVSKTTYLDEATLKKATPQCLDVMFFVHGKLSYRFSRFMLERLGY